ncbi:MAG: hypothetical protein ABI434_19905 [Burkholderiaceae bacterium]
MNCLASRVALDAAAAAVDSPAARWKFVAAKLGKRNRDQPDFWSKAGAIALALYEALAAGNLSGRLAKLIEDYADLLGRVTATRFWDSLFDHVRSVLRRYSLLAPTTEKLTVQTPLVRLKAWCKADRRHH